MNILGQLEKQNRKSKSTNTSHKKGPVGIIYILNGQLT